MTKCQALLSPIGISSDAEVAADRAEEEGVKIALELIDQIKTE